MNTTYTVKHIQKGPTLFIEPDGPGGGVCRCAEGFVGVAPGQSAVFYDGDAVLCGGIICPANA